MIKKSYLRICNFLCVLLMLLLLATQFLPFWASTKNESGSVSISAYFWNPREHKDVASSMKDLYMEYYGPGLRGADGKAFKFTANEIIMPTLIIFICAVLTAVLCTLFSKSPLPAIVPFIGGLSGTLGYLGTPALKAGHLWQLPLALSIADLLGSAAVLTDVIPEIGRKLEGLRHGKLKQKQFWKCRELYLLVLPAVAALILFSYVPMYGIIMGFQDVKIGSSFGSNEWIGLYNFKRFFESFWFDKVIRNTVVTSLVSHLLVWPIPIVLALLLHNSTSLGIKKTAQMTSYLPHLLSTVVVISILNLFCNGDSGLINILLRASGKPEIRFFAKDEWVLPMFVISNVWTSAGYSAIVYLGALSAVDEQQMEAAKIDGASKLQSIWHVQLPSILPTVVTMLILNMGSLFSIGAEKMLLMQTDLNLNASEIISTYVYKSGMTNAQYGFSTAVGLFQNVVNLIMMLSVNAISRKVSDTSVI